MCDTLAAGWQRHQRRRPHYVGLWGAVCSNLLCTYSFFWPRSSPPVAWCCSRVKVWCLDIWKCIHYQHRPVAVPNYSTDWSCSEHELNLRGYNGNGPPFFLLYLFWNVPLQSACVLDSLGITMGWPSLMPGIGKIYMKIFSAPFYRTAFRSMADLGNILGITRSLLFSPVHWRDLHSQFQILCKKKALTRFPNIWYSIVLR